MTKSQVIGALFVVIGLGIAAWGGRAVLRGLESRSWPVASGTILSSEVDSRRSNDRTRYRALVEYQYEVDGRIYIADRIRFGSVWGDRRSAERTARRYPEDTEVEVRYDPDETREAVLEAGATWGGWAILGFGLVFGLIGLMAATGRLRGSGQSG